MFSSITLSLTPPSLSTPPFGPTIQMTFTPTEYEAWKQSKASTSTVNLTSTSVTHAFLAFRSSWFIDSGASAHMTGTPSTLSSLTPITAYPPVSIVNGRSCSVKGYGSTKPTPSLTLHNVLYVSGFPTNLLSISTITHTLNCVAILYPFHCVFQDVPVRGLVWGVRKIVGCMFRIHLLYEIYVPHYLWSDAVIIATYLHNRLPSFPLGGAISLTRLFPNTSLFPLPPRVYGCIAFVQDYTPSLSKLAPHALKGVFVGYLRTQNG